MNNDKSGAVTQATGPGDISSKQTASQGVSLNEIESAFGPEVKLVTLSDHVVARFGLVLGTLPFHCELASDAGVTEASVAAVSCGGEQGLMGLAFFREESLKELEEFFHRLETNTQAFVLASYQQVTNQIREQFQEPKISKIVTAVASSQASNILKQLFC